MTAKFGPGLTRARRKAAQKAARSARSSMVARIPQCSCGCHCFDDRGGRCAIQAAIARALTERGVPTPRGGAAWTHTTVARVLERAAPCEH
ncbi:hypothetical protein CKO45_20455 [Paracraurococcus ruber]|uniref:Recombinase domain-containing protein n=2 Tax=Paracraurococcus ruber TaxID=77675 RepID=A0ABS1D2D0_9PROT|nr:hypothetical protein [Paracraurococcus ruber]